jgi:hypothetical protein
VVIPSSPSLSNKVSSTSIWFYICSLGWSIFTNHVDRKDLNVALGSLAKQLCALAAIIMIAQYEFYFLTQFLKISVGGF